MSGLEVVKVDDRRSRFRVPGDPNGTCYVSPVDSEGPRLNETPLETSLRLSTLKVSTVLSASSVYWEVSSRVCE